MIRQALLAVGCLALCSAVPVQKHESVAPPIVAYKDLVNDQLFSSSGSSRTLQSAMTSVGLVAITGIPNFANLRKQVLLGSYQCTKHASAAKTVELEDGTRRRTIAGVTKGKDGAQALDFGTNEGECSPSFREASTVFRNTVSEVAGAFADRMSELFQLKDAPMLWHVNRTHAYNNFRDIVQGADHLEHFHTYSQASPSAANARASTIDLHTDQGLFIAFTPALMVEDDGGEVAASGSSAGDFFLENKDKSRVSLDFGGGDMLVFMLGDGVEQYYNNRLQRGEPPLRSAPHGMAMPHPRDGESRVWYGRMFLPPKDALDEEHGLSFAQVREMAIQDVNVSGGLGSGIGCSRMLLQSDADPECTENQLYCWHRCMDLTEEVNEQACADQGLKLQCMNSRDQVVDVNNHGDHWPTCSNSETDETPPDPIEQPAADEECDAGTKWTDYLNLEAFDNSLEIHNGKTFLMWSVIDGTVKMRMAYNGYLGYMSIGIEDKRTREQGSSHPGMNGANVIMGIYDPDEELAFGSPFVGTTVKAYTIHDSLSGFRWWSDTAEELPAGAKMDVSDCFMSMEFTISDVHGQALNFTESTQNKLIWAIHTDSLLKGYHGYCNKGRMTLDFTATIGHIKHEWEPHNAFCAEPSDDEDADEHEGHDHGGEEDDDHEGHDHGEDDDDEIEDTGKPSGSVPLRASWLLAAAVAALSAATLRA